MQFKYSILTGMMLAALSGCGGGDDPQTTTPGVENKAPTVTVVSQSVKGGADVSIKATAADSDGSIASYSWVIKTGVTGLTLTNTTTDTVTFKAPVVSSNTEIVLTVTVTDDKGAKTSKDVSVTILANSLPVINNADSTAAGNSSVKITALASDADGTIAAYQWLRKSGPEVTLAGATTDTVTFTAPVVETDQTLVLTLTVTDNHGGKTSKDINILISKSATASLTGQVVKGVLANAALKVYKYVNNQPVELTPADVIGSLTTDATGNYNFSVLNYDGPLKITAYAAANGNTTMRCDAVDGCKKTNGQTAAFGDEVKLSDLDPNLQLNTITMVSTAAPVTGNISTLTHLAAELIAQKAAFSAVEMAKQKSLVMNSFGLEGDMDQLQPIAVDDTSKVAAATNKMQLKYSLINSAIANAVLNSAAKTGEVTTPAARLQAAATDLAANNGALRVQRDNDATFELALDEVFNAATQTSEIVLQRLGGAQVDNPALEDSLSNLATDFGHELVVRRESVGDDGRVVVVPTAPTNGDAMAKAVAMVQDVRVFANLIQGTGRNGEDFYGKVEDFDALSMAATDMVEEEADKFVLLAEVGQIISVIEAKLEADELSGTEFNLSQFSALPNLTGTLIYDVDTKHFKVDASTGDEQVNLEIKLTASQDMMTYNLALQGDITSKAATLKLAQGSGIELKLASPYDIDTAEFGVAPEPVKGTLKLQAELSQLASATVTNPMSFTGKIEGNLKLVSVPTYDKNMRPGTYLGFEFSNDSQIIPGALSLVGSLKNTQQDEVSVVLSAKINNIETFVASGLQYFGKKVPNGIKLEVTNDLNTLTMSSDGLTGGRVISYTPGAKPGEFFYESKSGDWTNNVEQKTRSLIKVTKETYDAGTGYTMLFGMEVDNVIRGSFWYKIYPVTVNGTTQYYLRTYHTGSYSETYAPLNAQGQPVDFEQVATAPSQNFSSVTALVKAQTYLFDPTVPTSNVLDMLEAHSDIAFIEKDISLKELGAAVVQLFEVDFMKLQQQKNLLINGYVVWPLLNEKATVTTNSDLTEAKLAFFQNQIVTKKLPESNESKLSFKIERLEGDWLRETTLFNIHRLQTNSDVYLACERFPFAGSFNAVTYIKKADGKLSQSFVTGVTVLPNGRVRFNNGTEVDSSTLTYSAPVTYSTGKLVEYCGADPDGAMGLTLAGTWTVPAAVYNGQYGVLAFAPEVAGVGYVKVVDFYKELLPSTNKQLNMTFNKASPSPAYELESGTNFLQVETALTVQAKIAGYQLSATLDATRTAIDDAKLGLNVVYKLPDATAQRSIKVAGATDSDLLQMENSEGVTAVFDRTIRSGATQAKIGEIKVNGEKMADILNRSGVVLIKYTNNNIESL
jgi:hypothetical protein